MGQLVSAQEVQYYDLAVQNWPGEIDFYRAMADKVKAQGGSVLEIGCGTGRVALRLAEEGSRIMGLDFSPAMLSAAGQKSQGMSNVRWVEGDMQDFMLGERFDLILIPGHSFQFMLTVADQLACLDCIRGHINSGGKLVVHLNHDDLSWLSELEQGKGTEYKLAGEYRLISTGGFVRQWTAWSYESCTQTASAETKWEIFSEDGTLKELHVCPKKDLHCFFRFEMEHLLARAGFEAEALYGDFFRQDFQNESPDMIWVAHAKQ